MLEKFKRLPTWAKVGVGVAAGVACVACVAGGAAVVGAIATAVEAEGAILIAGTTIVAVGKAAGEVARKIRVS